MISEYDNRVGGAKQEVSPMGNGTDNSEKFLIISRSDNYVLLGQGIWRGRSKGDSHHCHLFEEGFLQWQQEKHQWQL